MDEQRAVQLRSLAFSTSQALQDGEYVKSEARKLSRAAKHYVISMQTAHDAATKFHAELQSFGFKENQRDDPIKECAVVLAQLEALTHAMVSSLSSIFVDQLDKLVQSEELINISAIKEKVTNSKRQMDSAYRKLLEHKAEKPNEPEPKLQKSMEEGSKQLDEVLAEALRKSELWDKAARQEVSSALTQYMRQAYTVTQKSAGCMKGWDAKLVEDRSFRGSIAMRSVVDPSKIIVSPAAKEGYLFMRLANETSWNLRWFVLETPQRGGMLQWYKTWHSQSSPLGSLDCALLSVRPQSEENKQKGVFDLQSPRVGLTVRGQSGQDASDWIEALKVVIAGQLALAGSKSASSRVDAMRNQTILQNLRESNVANTFCADCSAPAPEWAAINHGVLICIECSGVHRSLGTHVSKVRSFTLDNWDEETVMLMNKLGNERAKGIWESHIPLNYKKPEPGAKRVLKEVYISCKWKERLFVGKMEKAKDELDTELAAAVAKDDLVQTAKLVACRADVNALTPKDLTRGRILHTAKSGEMAEFLLQNGADALQSNYHGTSPLLAAVEAGNVPLAALFFSRLSAPIPPAQRTQLSTAAEACKLPAMETLVKEKLASPREKGSSIQFAPTPTPPSPAAEHHLTSSPSKERPNRSRTGTDPLREVIRPRSEIGSSSLASSASVDSKEVRDGRERESKEGKEEKKDKTKLLRRFASLRGIAASHSAEH